MSESNLKTVVRRLPANLPEEIFWSSVKPWVTDETVTWKVFYSGKQRKRLNKENVPSRAYIAFKTDEQLAVFSREYDGHLFRDKEGNESYAIVEFAPYQKIPTEKKKADNRNATIDKDEDYVSFIQSLSAPAPENDPASAEYTLGTANQPPPKTTPLLEALKAEKAAAKEKEIQARAAQAKDNQTSKKDESKKKGQQGPKQAETQPMSKKAAKKAAAAAAGGSHQTAELSAGPNKGSTPVTPKSKAKSAGKQQPKPTHAPAAVVNVTLASKPAPAPNADVAASANTSAPSVARRARPVLGLGRQFEAALSGAGVSTNPERKPRREPPKPKEKTANQDTPGTSSDLPPSSPKKDRNNRRKVDAPVGDAASEAALILQRHSPRIITKNLESDGNASASPATPNASGSGQRGGFRRGRGRGRGGNPALLRGT